MANESWVERMAPIVAFIVGPFLLMMGGGLIIWVGFSINGELRIALITIGFVMVIAFGTLLFFILRDLWIDAKKRM